MKKLILFLMTMMLVGCSASLESDESAVTQAAEKEQACEPVAMGSQGCDPKTLCPSNKSITGMRMGPGVGGTMRQLWVYYNGAWRQAVDFGTAAVDIDIEGAIGGAGFPPLRKLTFTRKAYSDGPGVQVNAECVNPMTGANECLTHEMAWHRITTDTISPDVCNFGLWTAGLTRVVGLGSLTGDGEVSFRGYNKVGSGPVTYVSCDVIFRNSCSP